jgi:hypothetical protein
MGLLKFEAAVQARFLKDCLYHQLYCHLCPWCLIRNAGEDGQMCPVVRSRRTSQGSSRDTIADWSLTLAARSQSQVILSTYMPRSSNPTGARITKCRTCPGIQEHIIFPLAISPSLLHSTSHLTSTYAQPSNYFESVPLNHEPSSAPSVLPHTDSAAPGQSITHPHTDQCMPGMHLQSRQARVHLPYRTPTSQNEGMLHGARSHTSRPTRAPPPQSNYMSIASSEHPPNQLSA